MLTKLNYLVLIIFTLAIVGCQNGTGDLKNRQGSSDPFGAQIVVVNGNPDILFGNLTDQYEVIINVNESLTPDGTTVDFQLNSNSLPINERGCVLSEDNFTSNGQAVLNLLSGLYIDNTPDTTDDTPAIVNVGVTLTRAGGEKESQSFPVTINPVRLVAPADTDITTNPMGAPTTLFITLQFTTNGIPVGSIVQFEVSDPSLGDVENTMVPIQGTLADGQAAVQYTTINNTGGTQVVTGTIILPNPITLDPSCPSIVQAKRTLQASVVINQSAPEEVPMAEPETICNDSVDNDMDGFTDCADTDCDGAAGGPSGQLCGAEDMSSTCSDMFDNDANGFIDCADAACGGVDTPGGTCEFITEVTCNDDFDNNGNGNIDCADMNCDGKEGDMSGDLCEFGTETMCADGFDNDRDGDVDGADSDCP